MIVADKKARCFCVDGTNIIRGSHGYGGPDFRAQEDADSQRLIAALSQLCRELGDAVEIELVFDGGIRPWRPEASNLRVRFSESAQADDLIIDCVRGRRLAGGRVTVITGDRDLGQKISEDGARWQRVYPGASLEEALRRIESTFK